MSDCDVSGWTARWRPAEAQLRIHAVDLRSLRGKCVSNAWLVWDLDHDKWFADLPIAVRFDDGRQLEVCWQKFDDLSISWNTIDPSRPPKAWVSWSLEWRAQAHPALEKIIGRRVTRIDGTAHRFTTTRPIDRSDRTTSVWMVGGIWLQVEGSGLHIFNALDENGLSTEAPLVGSELRRFDL